MQREEEEGTGLEWAAPMMCVVLRSSVPQSVTCRGELDNFCNMWLWRFLSHRAHNTIARAHSHTHKRPYVTYATSRLLPRSTLGPLLSLYTAASALDRGLARIPGGFF